MSFLDLFAWIVLLILAASAAGVFCIAGWLPGHIAKSRGHPWAQAVTVAGWVMLICGFALWPVALIWAMSTCPHAKRGSRHDRRTLERLSGAAVRPSPFQDRSVQPLLEVLASHRPPAVAVRHVHPDGLGVPQGPALVLRHSVSVVPDVAGEVLDVPVEANAPLKAGDVLFRIDPAPYQAQVNALQAQLTLQETRLAQMTQLQTAGTGRSFDVEQRQAEAGQLRA
jgi:multidrug efflux pump subunit AcrA (membrane-fusion protein)